MIDDVSRDGHFIKVTRVGEGKALERVRKYPTFAEADAAYKELMFSKEAREKFLRVNRRRKR